VQRIKRLREGERQSALARLVILAHCGREARKAPILNHILDQAILGPEIRQGIQMGESKIARRLIKKRFGPVPRRAEEGLCEATCAAAEIQINAQRRHLVRETESLLVHLKQRVGALWRRI
jgi:hypothetical protein